MPKSGKAFALVLIVAPLILTCRLNPPTDEWFSPEAEALFVTASSNSNSTNPVSLYQLLQDGEFDELPISELPVEPEGNLLLVTGVAEQYLLMAFGSSLSDITSAYLIRLSDNVYFDLGTIGSVDEMVNYYRDPQPFQFDESGGVYFLSDGAIYRIDTTSENLTASAISPTGDDVDYFEVTTTGYVAYRTWEDDSRLLKPGGGLVMLPSNTFWAGPDGDIYFHKYIYEYDGESGGFYQIFHVLIEEDNSYSFELVEEDIGYMTVPWASLKASTDERVFIADDYIYRYIHEVNNPLSQPRTLSFLPEFESISYMAAADNDLLVTALTDIYQTYRIDPVENTYSIIESLSDFDIRSLYGISADRFVINALRLSDGKMVTGILSEESGFTVLTEELDHEVVYLARIN